jgi:hypothetical protein
MIEWFTANKLVLNLDETNIMKFVTNNSLHSALHIGYKEKYTEEMVKTKFLGLHIDNHLNWKNHIDQMIPKLSGACYAGRYSVSATSPIYFVYFRSIIKFGIIFWGNSSNKREDIRLTKENHQNYGWCMSYNSM